LPQRIIVSIPSPQGDGQHRTQPLCDRLLISAILEHGTATVQIGAWVKALWVLDRLDDLNGVLAQKASLLEQARAPRTRIRQRASGRA